MKPDTRHEIVTGIVLAVIFAVAIVSCSMAGAGERRRLFRRTTKPAVPVQRADARASVHATAETKAGSQNKSTAPQAAKSGMKPAPAALEKELPAPLKSSSRGEPDAAHHPGGTARASSPAPSASCANGQCGRTRVWWVNLGKRK